VNVQRDGRCDDEECGSNGDMRAKSIAHRFSTIRKTLQVPVSATFLPFTFRVNARRPSQFDHLSRARPKNYEATSAPRSRAHSRVAD
ncbi:MAG TPA: hypothetical protein VGM44_03790, partial [Polyangiaceae bacterium]|jgi:hypothetical protein